VYAVNPSVEEIDGERSYASLKDIPHHIDIVDVFRRAEHLPGIVEQAIEVEAGVVWAQLGVANQEAAKRAHEAGMPIIQDTCIKVEHTRLLG
jgi:hypothetical protein